MSDMQSEIPTRSETIVLPHDPKRQGDLHLKQKEYTRRLLGSKDPKKVVDAVYKNVILGAVLRYGEARYADILEKVKQKTPPERPVDMKVFDFAWDVIWMHCHLKFKIIIGSLPP